MMFEPKIRNRQTDMLMKAVILLQDEEDAYRFCMDYCMETLDAAHVFPMHFWGDHELAKIYLSSLKSQHPDWFERFHLIRFEGEHFSL